MSEEAKENIEDIELEDQDMEPVSGANDESPMEEDLSEEEPLDKQLENLKEQLEKEKREYMFLMADFDNFRKRTLKEKSELIRNGAESVMRGILPIIDDFERGLAAMEDSNDASSIKEGIALIYNKFIKYIEQNGVKVIDSTGAEFNTEQHEAVAMVPVDNEAQKGKVIDTMSKGYTLNDKVIRHAKVAVGE